METDRYLAESVFSLEQYISAENYRGYDPYDGLMSPLFRLPLLGSNKTLRFYSQQILKRIPFNYRPLLGIKKGLNPVTLGLCIQAYTYLLKSGTDTTGIEEDYIKDKIKLLIKELKALSSKGFSGYCWGYDFDWEAKYASNPAYTPTIVATGIITNGLFEYYNLSNDIDAIEMIKGAAEFALKDLKRNYDGDYFCFSYSPFDDQKVYNASMKAARLLAQVYSVTGEKSYYEEAHKAAAYVAKNQNEDGSWDYSKDDGRVWKDNFHTGYILDCLDKYIRHTGDMEFSDAMNGGYQYYKDNFFAEDEKDRVKRLVPKYYNNRTYPVDSTSLAQSVLTLCRFGDTEKASAVMDYALAEMYGNKKYFYYRVNKFRKEKISFMRWSNAWMFCAIAFLLYKSKEKKT